jgi:hypothetical protein
MRKIVVSSIAALAAMGFAAAAQADGDCGWGHVAKVAQTPKPAAESTKTVKQTAIPVKKTVAQTTKTIKTEKGS